MTKETFYRILKSRGVDCTYVRFNDSISDDVFCVCAHHGVFDVFYRERGIIFDLKSFTVFSDVVDDLSRRMSFSSDQ